MNESSKKIIKDHAKKVARNYYETIVIYHRRIGPSFSSLTSSSSDEGKAEFHVCVSTIEMDHYTTIQINNQLKCMHDE